MSELKPSDTPNTSTEPTLLSLVQSKTISSKTITKTKTSHATRAQKKYKKLDPHDPSQQTGALSSPPLGTKSEPLENSSVNHTEHGELKYNQTVNALKDVGIKHTPASADLDERSKTWKVNVTLSEKQCEAQNAPEPILLYGGAKGGGKSWWLCIWVFYMALKYPGNKLFFFRRRSVDFTNTTLETWRKAIPSNMYRINEHKKKIYVMSSVVDYGGLDDPLLVQSLNSAEYAQGGVDQAEEIERDQFAMLRGTMRHRLPDGTCPPYQIRMTANPAQCWLKDDFITNPREGFKFVSALPTDNPYLPPDYTKNLAEAFKHRPSLLAAYLHGSWDDLASHDIIIQGAWTRDCTNINLRGTPIKRIVVNDPARYGNDENVIYVMEQSERGIYILDTVILEHKSLMDTAGRLASLRRKWDANMIGVDSIGIGAGIVDALMDLGEPVLSINSSNRPTIETQQCRYYNLRSQMWGEAGKVFFERKISIPDDMILKSQLSSVKFRFQSGKMLAESKDEIKERSGGSPDRADDIVMGIYTLEQAPRLDAAEYRLATEDRVGYGTPVGGASDEEGVGADMNFSGYGEN